MWLCFRKDSKNRSRSILIEDKAYVMESMVKSIEFEKESYINKLHDFLLDDSKESIRIDIKNYILRSEVEFNGRIFMSDVIEKLTDDDYNFLISKVIEGLELNSGNLRSLGIVEIIADRHDYGTLHVSIYKVDRVKASIEKKIRENLISDAKLDTLRRIARDFNLEHEVVLDIKIEMGVAEMLMLNGDSRTNKYMKNLINEELLNDIAKTFNRNIYSDIKSYIPNPHDVDTRYFAHVLITFKP